LARPDGAGIVTTWEPIEEFDDLMNFDLVKVVVGEDGQAIYFQGHLFRVRVMQSKTRFTECGFTKMNLTL
jgi:CMP-2-keto-3-deoxyoctulosonic acid synthetase